MGWAGRNDSGVELTFRTLFCGPSLSCLISLLCSSMGGWGARVKGDGLDGMIVEGFGV